MSDSRTGETRLRRSVERVLRNFNVHPAVVREVFGAITHLEREVEKLRGDVAVRNKTIEDLRRRETVRDLEVEQSFSKVEQNCEQYRILVDHQQKLIKNLNEENTKLEKAFGRHHVHRGHQKAAILAGSRPAHDLLHAQCETWHLDSRYLSQL